jgi:hypothetical protein
MNSFQFMAPIVPRVVARRNPELHGDKDDPNFTDTVVPQRTLALQYYGAVA